MKKTYMFKVIDASSGAESYREVICYNGETIEEFKKLYYRYRNQWFDEEAPEDLESYLEDALALHNIDFSEIDLKYDDELDF